MTPRRPLNVLLVAATAGGMVVAAAVPGSAVGGSSKNYKARVDTSVGSTIASPAGLGNLTLSDDLSGGHTDVVYGDASRSEKLSVKGNPCTSSSLAFYGVEKQWANMGSTALPTGGRMRLYCTYSDGAKHTFHWGMTMLTGDGDASDPGRKNCLVLSRTTGAGVSPTRYTVSTPDPSAPEQCPALHEILHRNGTKTLIDAAEDVRFHVTFTVNGAVPVG